MPRPNAPLLAVLLAAVCAGGAGAQADASLGIGAGTVRYPGGSGIGIVSVAPALHIGGFSPQLSIGASLAALSAGDWYGESRLGVWAASPPLGRRWRLAGDFALAGATRGAGTGTGAAQLVNEILSVGPRWGVGVGVGPSSGWITHAAPATALHTRLRAWWQDAGAQVALSGSVEPTRLLGAWFTDIGAGVVARRGRVEVQISATGRVSATYGSKAAALASAEWRLAPRVALEATGGSMLPDPFQGLPRSGFVTLALRFHFATHTDAPVLALRGGPLSVARREGGLLIRLRERGAHTVSIAADWNDWTPTALTRIGPENWEIAIHLPPGTYHFTLLVDGTAWTIPDAIPSVPDGWGGRVAVLTIM